MWREAEKDTLNGSSFLTPVQDVNSYLILQIEDVKQSLRSECLRYVYVTSRLKYSTIRAHMGHGSTAARQH
jgi:hypothetical protein